MVVRELVTKWGLDVDDAKLNQFQNDLLKVKGVANQVGTSVRNIGQTVASFAGQWSVGVTAPIVLFAKKAIGAAGEIQALELSLVSIMGSAAAGRAELEKLTEAAKAPGLGFKEAIQASVRLQSVGFSADDAREALIQFSNAVATTGGRKDTLERVMTQLVQMAASGKIITQDLRPILQQAPAVATAVKKMFGTIDPKKLEDMGISSEIFIRRLMVALGEIPRVAGGIGNDMDNISDLMQRSFATLGSGLGKTILPIFIKWAETVAKVADWFDRLAPYQKSFITWTLLAAAGLGPVLYLLTKLAAMGTIIWGMVTAFGALAGSAGIGAALLSFGSMIVVALAAGAVLVALYLVFEEINTVLNGGKGLFFETIDGMIALKRAAQDAVLQFSGLLGLAAGLAAMVALLVPGAQVAAPGLFAMSAGLLGATAVGYSSQALADLVDPIGGAAKAKPASYITPGFVDSVNAQIQNLGLDFTDYSATPFGEPSYEPPRSTEYDVPPAVSVVVHYHGDVVEGTDERTIRLFREEWNRQLRLY